jgi:HPt (histidine-containing phosphotransfer) domain-containing protein
MAGLVDPADAPAGAVIGGVAPGVVKGAGTAGAWLGDKMRSGGESLMWSALKPTQRARESGDAAVAVRELLDRGINPTKGGVQKLQNLLNKSENELTQAIASSPVRVSRDRAVSTVNDVRQRFGQQVSPSADLSAIDSVVNDFLATNPRKTISVQDAQAMKRGTYRVLSGKYGELGSADTEAQKAIARGLKDEISRAVPGVAQQNEEIARLIKTLNVTERRALLEMNKNPAGLAALAVNHPSAFVAFMADRSAAFKSLAARTLNQTGGGTSAVSGGLLGIGENPLVRAGLLEATLASQQ